MERHKSYRAHGIHWQENEAIGPEVLYMDSCGWWAPLSDMYFSKSSDKIWLLTRHPESVIEDIVGRYCPQCSTRYTGDDAVTYQNKCSSCFGCPICASPLSVVASSDQTCIFQCGYCYWRSDSIESTPFVATDSRELETLVLTHEREAEAAAEEAFSLALRKQRELQVMAPNASSSLDCGRRWSMKDLENKLSADGGIYSRLTDSDPLICPALGVGSPPMPLVPHRIKLRSKRTLRSRLDIQKGRMKILMQPKPNPLDGDSSQKNRGGWWAIDSSAVHEFPRYLA